MTARTGRAVAGVAVALAVLLTACSRGAPTVDPSFTRAQAQDRLVVLLSQTLVPLPAALSLTLAEPQPGFGDKEGAVVVPCTDDNTVDDPPVNLSLDYWVAGFPPPDGPEVLRALEDSLRSSGFEVRPSGTSSIYGYTPDGYALVAQLNSRGGLSLGGSTPCFPRAAADATGPEPSVVPHP